jgi:hypothetical protein
MAEKARREAALGASVGERAAAELGHAAEAMALETLRTDLTGERALVGHVIGMHLCLPAGHFHGPRETPALIYLFADALAIRPTDDAPMSTIPIFGLHMVLPPLAVARWLYKAGRIEHANLDLVKDAARFAATIAQWNVDDFAEADEKLEVHRLSDMGGPVHVYGHLGFANVLLLLSDGRLVRLKSALPSSSEAYVKLWELFSQVTWPHGLSTTPPVEAPEPATNEAPERAANEAPEPEHDPAEAGTTGGAHSGPQEETGCSQAAGPRVQ